MQTVIFSGLHCEACTKLLTKKLSKINGVLSVISGDILGEFKVESAQTLTESDINKAVTGTEYSLVSIK